MRTLLALTLALGLVAPSWAQAPAPDSADVASPEAIVAAVYASLDRPPGERHDWDRFLSLYAPDAILMPNPEQTGGAERTFTPPEYADHIRALYDDLDHIGSAADQGFQEKEVHQVLHRFGDIAHVFSTYEKFFWQDDRMLGRGINSLQLARRDGRWWIVSGVWDEEVGAGAVPAEYMAE